MQKGIAVIGSYNVGFNVETDRLPVWGETLLGGGFFENNGGKGANQAVAAARLGGTVSFIGAVGDDHYGDDGMAMLTNEGIDVSKMKRIVNVPTGVGFVFLNDQGRKLYFGCAGCQWLSCIR